MYAYVRTIITYQYNVVHYIKKDVTNDIIYSTNYRKRIQNPRTYFDMFIE